MSSPYRVRVLVADDHEVLREGFRTMIKKDNEIELVGEASDGIELLELVEKLLPDVVVTDIKMPHMDGIDATRKLKQKFPNIGVIAFTMYDEDNLIIDMLEAGANGYLVKNATKEEISEAIKTVHGHETYYCKNTSARLKQMIARSPFNPYKIKPLPQFNDVELAIIRLICKEYSNKQIAQELNLSRRTIEGHRIRIQEKMNVKNGTGIAVYAMKKGIYRSE